MTNKVVSYTPALVYWNGLSAASAATQIPWGDTFSAFGSGDIGIITGDLGADAAGLYVNIVDPVTTRKIWKLVMPLAGLTAALASASTLTVVVNSSGTATYASPNVVYGNGQVISGGGLVATTTIVYVIVTPPVGAGSGVFTVATLPSAAIAGAGARSFVTDANSATFNAAVVGGGSNKMPVVSDGSAWHIG